MGCVYSSYRRRRSTSNDVVNTTSVQVPWSELPADVLCLIAKNLNIIDRGFFSSMCRSWRSAVKESSYAKDPWIILRENRFFSCKNGRTYRSLRPIASKKSMWMYLLGGSEGWLLMHRLRRGPKSVLSHFCLFNPINGNQITLPTYDDEEIIWGRCSMDSVMSSDNIPRVVYVMIYFFRTTNLAFSRKVNGGSVGFQDWIVVKGLVQQFIDFTCHQGFVYISDGRRLITYHVDHDTGVATRVKVFSYPTEMMEGGFRRIVQVKESIMVMKGYPFSVHRRLGWKLEEQQGEEYQQYKWIPFDDLGGEGCELSLFVDSGTPCCVLPICNPGMLKENHIYYVKIEINSDERIVSVNLGDGVTKTLTIIPPPLVLGCMRDYSLRPAVRWIYA